MDCWIQAVWTVLPMFAITVGMIAVTVAYVVAMLTMADEGHPFVSAGMALLLIFVIFVIIQHHDMCK